MYQVVKIERCCRTTFLLLRNVDTNTIDYCFDDSRVVSDDNFDFMKVGGYYECKITLFGDVPREDCKNAVLCARAGTVIVGRRPFEKVFVGNDEYYIPTADIKEIEEKRNFFINIPEKI